MSTKNIDTNEVTLDNVGGEGYARELFAREWESVLNNALDPNTPAKATREVVIKIRFTPDESRDSGTITVEAKSKLAAVRQSIRRVFLGRRGERAVAVDVVQTNAFPPEPDAASRVTPMRTPATG